jgi:hypothetical protein
MVDMKKSKPGSAEKSISMDDKKATVSDKASELQK